MSDFTVYEDVISDCDIWLETDSVEGLIAETFEYHVDMEDIKKAYPQIFTWYKNIDNETFKAGQEIRYDFADLIIKLVEANAYDDYRQYIHTHQNLKNPCRHLKVIVNNPDCFPSAEEKRKRESRELGKFLGKALGLNKGGK